MSGLGGLVLLLLLFDEPLLGGGVVSVVGGVTGGEVISGDQLGLNRVSGRVR